MFDEELSVEERAAIEKRRKDRLTFVITIVLVVVAMLAAFFCGYEIRDVTNTSKMGDYEYIKNLVEQNYNFSEYDANLAEHTAINGYLDALGDKYAIYLSPEEYEKRQMHYKGEDISLGINFTINENQQIVVSELVADGNACGSGIKVGDIILSVNGHSTKTYAEYQSFAIQNKFNDGDKVEVVVLRGEEEMSFVITTKKIVKPTCELEFIDNVAYIKLSTFSDTSAKLFEEHIKTIKKTEDCSGIIIDLRNNGGGLLSSMKSIGSNVFAQKTLLTTFVEKQETTEHWTKTTEHHTDLPIVILVNGNSASASECFSGALQHYNRATIIGTQTFGKGIGQTTYHCPSGGYVTFTTAKYYLPNGTCIHEIGITPDIVVELPNDILTGETALTKDNDVQLKKALEIFKK